jgi:hypothetical protein
MEVRSLKIVLIEVTGEWEKVLWEF